MAYVTNEDVVKDREMDLLSYLQNCEPDNLRHVSCNVFCTADHDSLVISNGKWFWFSQGYGGRSALDYLMKVRGMKLPEAVMKLNGCSPTVKPYVPQIAAKKEFVMPVLSESTWRAESYLKQRGIDSEIIKHCILHFSCHVLRHTFATRMIESGASIKFLQTSMGHSEIQTTMDIYVTVTNEYQHKEIKPFEDYMKSSFLLVSDLEEDDQLV